jgi:hypothetical protein
MQACAQNQKIGEISPKKAYLVKRSKNNQASGMFQKNSNALECVLNHVFFA